jgi:hypothetical protein
VGVERIVRSDVQRIVESMNVLAVRMLYSGASIFIMLVPASGFLSAGSFVSPCSFFFNFV